MMVGRVYVGDSSPKAYVLVLDREDGDDIDLTTVETAELSVLRKGETSPVTWAASISHATTTAITLTHVFAADGTDLPNAGLYAVVARLTTPGGVLSSDTYALPVRARFDTRGD